MQLLLSIVCFVLMAWCVVSTVASLRRHPAGLEIVAYLLPTVYAALPHTLEALAPDSPSRSVFLVIVSAYTAVLAVRWIMGNKMYRTTSNLTRFGFVFLECVPLSAVWCIQEQFQSESDVYLLGCVVFGVILAFAFRLCPANENCGLPDVSEALHEVSEAPPRWPRTMVTCGPQHVFCGVDFIGTMILMTLLNAYAAARMPGGLPLPDVVHKAFTVASTLREKSVGTLQLSNIACLLNGAQLILSWILRPENLNIPRLAFVWGTISFVRSFAFTLTSLPAPCAGLAHCPCADPEIIQLLATLPPIKIALSWFFGAGVYLKYPQCGDLIISGHTLFLWVSFRTLADFLRRTFRQPFGRLFIFLDGASVAASLGHIVISRNHYTVDVFFGWLLPEAIWQIYQLAANTTRQNMAIVRFIRWLETRKFPLAVSQPSSETGV
jgi:hypothetical protein